MTDLPDDVNAQAVADWVDDTTPFERVQTVMKRTYEPQTADEIAEQARTTPTTARKHLRALADAGIVETTAEPDQNATLYRRAPESQILEQASRILDEVDASTLTARIAEMQNRIQTYREDTGADSPEDAVLRETGIDSETVQAWQTTRRNLGFAKVALALNDCTSSLQSPPSLQTVTADRNDWSNSTPTDAGDSLFGDRRED